MRSLLLAIHIQRKAHITECLTVNGGTIAIGTETSSNMDGKGDSE